MSGSLGEVYHVVASFRAHRSIPGLGGSFTTKAVSGGGTLIDWGVHRLDIIMYCTGDPEPLSASGKAYCKLGADMKGYVYESMWSENTKNTDGTYDVDDFVTAFVRTKGPTITLNGAWAQNIGVGEDYIDFLGTKAGIRLTYGGGFKVYGTTPFGTLYSDEPHYEEGNMYQKEIASFIRCVREGVRDAAHIDNAILTSKIMQGIYDSSDSGREIVFR
jgi:predicted dehydrogenase